MTKIKKLLFSLATVAVVSTPIVAAVSCGGGKTTENALPQNYIKPADRVAVIKPNESFTEAVAKQHQGVKIALITDAGHVTDKSFNQSSWEAVNEIYDQSKGNVLITDVEPSKSEQVEFTNAYYNALQNGYNVWVLSGFSQNEALSAFLKSQQNVDLLKQNKVKIITVDFFLTSENNPLNYSDIYSLLFDVQDGSYIGGQAIADYLAQTYSGADNQAKRTVGTFGGLDIFPVTNYIMALMKGVYAFNQTAEGRANPTQVNPGQDKVNLTSDFVVSSKMDAVINNLLSTSNPNVIFPVAGPATDETIKILNEGGSKYQNTTIIGVDVDQAIGKADATRFDFSVTKNIGQAVYDVVLATTYGIDPKGLLRDKEANKPLTLTKGLDAGWVGNSVSHLADSRQKELMDSLIKKYTDAFKKLSPEQIKLIRSYKLADSDTDMSTNVPEFLTKLLGLINKTTTN